MQLNDKHVLAMYKIYEDLSCYETLAFIRALFECYSRVRADDFFKTVVDRIPDLISQLRSEINVKDKNSEEYKAFIDRPLPEIRTKMLEWVKENAETYELDPLPIANHVETMNDFEKEK